VLPSDHYRQPGAGAILGALHDISARFGYLPENEVRAAASELGVPVSQMFSAATFYAAFSFQPTGRHKIQVCEGTACYVKGSGELLARLRAVLGISPDDTTPDLNFTLKRVRCVGSCGLAPVVRVDGDTYGQLTPGSLDQVLARYRKE
jgi:NADH:ubiquinone oxidoreductase subunit E